MARLQARAADMVEKSMPRMQGSVLGCALVVMYAICGALSKEQQVPKGCLLGISWLGVR